MAHGLAWRAGVPPESAGRLRNWALRAGLLSESVERLISKLRLRPLSFLGTREVGVRP